VQPEQELLRTLILGGKEYKENKLGIFISWKCRDYSDRGKTLVEVGRITLPDDFKKTDEYKEMDDATKQKLNEIMKMTGFILYDGTNTGDIALYTHAGLNHRWDWGPKVGTYSFVIKPDGTGLFYDFRTAKKGVKDKADDVYKCSR